MNSAIDDIFTLAVNASFIPVAQTGAMIDVTRMNELRAEIGQEDLAMILDVYLTEAEEMLGRLAECPSVEERGKALHFLRSGALNLGLEGLAASAATDDGDLSALRDAYHATRLAVGATA
ncbi:MAG: histidine kinase [Pseudomonadota bacterium]